MYLGIYIMENKMKLQYCVKITVRLQRHNIRYVYISFFSCFFFSSFFFFVELRTEKVPRHNKEKVFSSEKRENLYLFLFLETQKGFKYSQDITGDRIIIFNPCFAKNSTRELKCSLQRSSNRPADCRSIAIPRTNLHFSFC